MKMQFWKEANILHTKKHVRFLYKERLLLSISICCKQDPTVSVGRVYFLSKGPNKSESNSWNLGQSHLSTGSGAEVGRVFAWVGTHWMLSFYSFLFEKFKKCRKKIIASGVLTQQRLSKKSKNF